MTQDGKKHMIDEHTLNMIQAGFHETCVDVYETLTRPAILYRPTLTHEFVTTTVRRWIARYSGVSGFGDTPAEAMFDFDKKFNGK